MNCSGAFTTHVLQCKQFSWLMHSFVVPSSDFIYSYTCAGQNRCSGPSKTFNETSFGTLSIPFFTPIWESWF